MAKNKYNTYESFVGNFQKILDAELGYHIDADVESLHDNEDEYSILLEGLDDILLASEAWAQYSNGTKLKDIIEDTLMLELPETREQFEEDVLEL